MFCTTPFSIPPQCCHQSTEVPNLLRESLQRDFYGIHPVIQGMKSLSFLGLETVLEICFEVIFKALDLDDHRPLKILEALKTLGLLEKRLENVGHAFVCGIVGQGVEGIE